jgi:hypothetical protein
MLLLALFLIIATPFAQIAISSADRRASPVSESPVKEIPGAASVPPEKVLDSNKSWNLIFLVTLLGRSRRQQLSAQETPGQKSFFSGPFD